MNRKWSEETKGDRQWKNKIMKWENHLDDIIQVWWNISFSYSFFLAAVASCGSFLFDLNTKFWHFVKTTTRLLNIPFDAISWSMKNHLSRFANEKWWNFCLISRSTSNINCNVLIRLLWIYGLQNNENGLRIHLTCLSHRTAFYGCN